jgi:thiol-disulfide isomerase/thioredoxin
MDPTTPPPEGPTARSSRRVIGPFTVKHVVAVLVTVAATGILLAVLTSPISGPTTPVAPVPGASFYLVGEPGIGLAIGDRPPALATVDGPIMDTAGEPVDLTAYEGRPVWVVFWATWCPPCQRETPDLQKAYAANRDDGLELVAVNVQESADVARDYATTYGLTYRIALDPSAGVFRAWGVFGLPTHYFIGRDGRIRDRWFGPLSLAEMQKRVDLIEGT